MIWELKKEIEQAHRIALVCHVSPDMDTLGSAAGLSYVLRAMGKDVVIYDQDEVPARFLFLDGLSAVRRPDDEVFDLCISMDVSDPERMGTAKAVFDRTARRALIDHHRTTLPFAPVCVLHPEAAATAQIVVELCGELGWAIPPEAAMCLCAGLSTDTGNFSFDSVTGNTFRAAGVCVDCGAKTNVITENLYRTSTRGHILMLGRVLNGLTLHGEGRIAVMRVSSADLLELNATQEDTDGIVNFGLEIVGVQTAVLLSEREGLVKCSLRAKEPLDVAQVAARFSGGGHIRAAGCSLPGKTLKEAAEIIIHALEEIVQ